MTVNITFSAASDGSALGDTVDIGSAMTPGLAGDPQDMFISHDAQVGPITSCAFYADRYAGDSYPGVDADQDYTEIMAWGDDATGGFEVHQGIPAAWTVGDSFWDDTPSGGQVFKNGYGDINAQLELATTAISIGAANAGEIALNGEAHVQVRVSIPSSVPLGANHRALSLVMAYSATS